MGRGFCPLPTSSVKPGLPVSWINQSFRPPWEAVPTGSQTLYPLEAENSRAAVSPLPGVRSPYRQ